MSTLFLRQSLKLLNAIDLMIISVVMVAAFFLQFYLHELPCPFCLLQRLGLLAIGFGFLLNMRFRPRPGHYMLSLLAAVFTSFIALRQISLHIVPGTGSYGQALFGLHLYTWVFIACNFAVIYVSILLSFRSQYSKLLYTERITEMELPWQRFICNAAFVVFFVLTLANALNIFLQCGTQECPDNPVGYVFKL